MRKTRSSLALLLAVALQAKTLADNPTTLPVTEITTQLYDVSDFLVVKGVKASAKQAAASQELYLKQLCDQVIHNTGTGSWEGQAGGKGVIRTAPTGSQLVVRQSSEVHSQIAAWLQKQRTAQNLQVSVETYFIVAKMSGLRDIGMNPDTLQPANTNKSAAITYPTTAPAGKGGYLEESRFHWLMDHMDDIGGKVIASPSLLMLNGQEGEIRAMDKVQPYVESVEPTTRSSGDNLYRMHNGLAESGLKLKLKANVSADQKYITLVLDQELITYARLDTFSFTTKNVGNKGDGREISIQMPAYDANSIKTIISVPNGQWLLMGGAKVETEKDGGKILMVLVRPKIVANRPD